MHSPGQRSTASIAACSERRGTGTLAVSWMTTRPSRTYPMPSSRTMKSSGQWSTHTPAPVQQPWSIHTRMITPRTSTPMVRPGTEPNPSNTPTPSTGRAPEPDSRTAYPIEVGVPSGRNAFRGTSRTAQNHTVRGLLAGRDVAHHRRPGDERGADHVGSGVVPEQAQDGRCYVERRARAEVG